MPESSILKGGVLMAAFAARRPTRDIDFAATGFANDTADVEQRVRSIIEVHLNDGLEFDPDSAVGEPIRDEADYSGVRVKITAQLATAKVALHVDVNFGDPIWPAPTEAVLPLLLGGTLRLAGYPDHMVLAEKIVTAIERGDQNVVDTADHAAREMVVHETTFRTEEPGIDGPSVQAIYSELAADAERNAMITGHVRGAADQGRTCLVLTNRLQHLDALADALESCASPVIRLHGRLTAANRRDIRHSLEEMDAQQQPFVLVAIDKIAGEGLDLPTLNTLFLTVPVSFKGRVIQQIGRITRGRAEHSMPAIVHDYRDKNVPILERMYSRRRRVMSKEGFVTAEPAE
jgi:hypothetical protein